MPSPAKVLSTESFGARAKYYTKDFNPAYDNLEKYMDKGPHVDPEMKMFAMAVARGALTEDEGIRLLQETQPKGPLTKPAIPVEGDDERVTMLKTFGWMVAVGQMEHEEAVQILGDREHAIAPISKTYTHLEEPEQIMDKRLQRYVELASIREDAAHEWNQKHLEKSFHRAVMIETVRLNKNSTLAEPRDDAHPSIALALGIDTTRPLTELELANVLAGNRADGDKIPGKQYQQATDFKPSVTAIDIVYAPDKTVSVAWATAPNDAERAMILQAHRAAVDDTATDLLDKVGYLRDGTKAHAMYVKFDHFTARPSEKGGVGDPHVHTHIVVLNVVVGVNGKVHALDGNRFKGLGKETGDFYHLRVAENLRRIGVEVTIHEDGTARLDRIPDKARALFSKRSVDIRLKAIEYAESKGVAWNDIGPETKARLLTFVKNRSKHFTTGIPNFQAWEQQSVSANWWNHGGVIHKVEPTKQVEATPLGPDLLQNVKSLDRKVKEGLNEARYQIEFRKELSKEPTILHRTFQKVREHEIVKKLVDKVDNWFSASKHSLENLGTKTKEFFAKREQLKQWVYHSRDKSGPTIPK